MKAVPETLIRQIFSPNMSLRNADIWACTNVSTAVELSNLTEIGTSTLGEGMNQEFHRFRIRCFNLIYKCILHCCRYRKQNIFLVK
jgi:hypothetical protein